jgi:hypothetical protein
VELRLAIFISCGICAARSIGCLLMRLGEVMDA